jgi:mycothiol synthase
MSTWKIEPVGECDQTTALALLFASETPATTLAQVAQAQERIAAGTADIRSLVWAIPETPTPGPPAIGACWIEGQAGNVGYLHPPVVDRALPEHERCEQELFQATEAAAKAAGITWLQILLDPGAETKQILSSFGFSQVSTLVYQAALLPVQVREPSLLRIRPLPYKPNQRSELETVLAATYVGSLDCPTLNGTRHPAETLQSYETIGQSGTHHWQLIYRGEEPIGCLLLAIHKPEQPATQLFGELVYWGVIPNARGQGLGGEILELALWQATKLDLDKLVLAVDAANEPALRLYAALGFFEWLRKEAWGKQVCA